MNPDWDGVMKHRARQAKPSSGDPWVWRAADAELSRAYVRLRKILGAFETPEAPSGPQIWEHTEQCAREAVMALRGVLNAGQCCQPASVGKPHHAHCLTSKVLRRIDRFGGGIEP